MKGGIIKCKDCGFKYYDGDVHKCVPVGVVDAGEKPKAMPAHAGRAGRKVPVKTQKDSFKIWKEE